MDYYKIGQKIRQIRKSQGLSQEELAEQIDISTTHMSHIETGNTKMSLPVFVEIASVLGVKTDDLLEDSAETAQEVSLQEIESILERCSVQEAKILIDIMKATKLSLERHL